MSKFILQAGSTVELNFVIARDGGEKDSVSPWIYSDDDVDIASWNGGDFAVSVDATDVEIEWVFCNIEIIFFGQVDGGLGFDGIKETNGGAEIKKREANKGGKNYFKNDADEAGDDFGGFSEKEKNEQNVEDSEEHNYWQ